MAIWASMARRPASAGLSTEVILASIVLFILTGGISAFLAQRFTTGGPDFEQWPYEYPFTLAGLVGAGLLGSHLPRLASPAAKLAAGVVGVYVGWSLVSVNWSIIPHLTSSRALTAVGVMCFAVWFGTTLSVRQQMLAVAAAMAVFVAASLLLVVAVPNYGRGAFRDFTGGRFRGLTANPNSLGPLCVLSLITFLAMAWTSPDIRQRAAWTIGGVVALGLLLGSRSETALATAGLAVGMGAAVYAVGASRRRGIEGRVVAGSAALVVVVGSLVAWREFWQISELLSDDDTFGNRRRIWNHVIEVANLRPWRGWGYWAFWNVTNSGAVIRYGSAHNSLLEVYLGLGRFGVVPFALIVMLAVVGTARRLWLSFTPATAWLSVVVGTLLVGHVTESFVLWHSYNWALVCGTSVGCWTWSADREEA